jgi:hypothetical protein
VTALPPSKGFSARPARAGEDNRPRILSRSGTAATSTTNRFPAALVACFEHDRAMIRDETPALWARLVHQLSTIRGAQWAA